MSLREYLHEKAEESRHNETSAYLMFIAGTVLFTGGILETLHTANALLWLLFIPCPTQPNPGGVLGLALTISGMALLIFGLGAGIHYQRDRAWYMEEIQRAHSMENLAMAEKRKPTTNNNRKNTKKTTPTKT